MIKVTVCTINNNISSIHIHGHANSAKKGQDLVCAGVSSIGVGALNALDQLCAGTCSLTMDDADIRIETTSQESDVQSILQTLYIQLQTMEEQYREYINIVKEEV